MNKILKIDDEYEKFYDDNATKGFGTYYPIDIFYQLLDRFDFYRYGWNILNI